MLVPNHPSLIKCLSLLENENWSTQCGHNNGQKKITLVNITKVTHALKIIQYEKYKLVKCYLVQTTRKNARILDVRQSCSESGTELSIFIWDLIFHTRTNLRLVSNLWFVYAPFLCNFPFGLQGFRRKSHLHWRWFTKKFVNSSKHVLVWLDELNWKHTQGREFMVMMNLSKTLKCFYKKTHESRLWWKHDQTRPAAAWQKQPTAEIPVKGQKHSRKTVKTLFLINTKYKLRIKTTNKDCKYLKG